MIITATEIMKRNKFYGRYPVDIKRLHKRLTMITRQIAFDKIMEAKWVKFFKHLETKAQWTPKGQNHFYRRFEDAKKSERYCADYEREHDMSYFKERVIFSKQSPLNIIRIPYLPVFLNKVPDTGRDEYYYRCISFMVEERLNGRR